MAAFLRRFFPEVTKREVLCAVVFAVFVSATVVCATEIWNRYNAQDIQAVQEVVATTATEVKEEAASDTKNHERRAKKEHAELEARLNKQISELRDRVCKLEGRKCMQR